jgi:hypothetical protein
VELSELDARAPMQTQTRVSPLLRTELPLSIFGDSCAGWLGGAETPLLSTRVSRGPFRQVWSVFFVCAVAALLLKLLYQFSLFAPGAAWYACGSNDANWWGLICIRQLPNVPPSSSSDFDPTFLDYLSVVAPELAIIAACAIHRWAQVWASRVAREDRAERRRLALSGMLHALALDKPVTAESRDSVIALLKADIDSASTSSHTAPHRA